MSDIFGKRDPNDGYVKYKPRDAKGGKEKYLEWPEKRQEIIDNIREFLSIRQAAWASKVSDPAINWWMKWGKEALARDEDDNIHAQFYLDARKAQSEKIKELIDNIFNRRDGWQANAWLLERCFREDFGSDAAKMAEVTDEILKLKELFMQFKKPDDIYGDNPDGQAVDTENKDEERGA